MQRLDVQAVHAKALAKFETLADQYQQLAPKHAALFFENIVKKEGTAQFDIDGNLFKEARMKMTIDGYTAPVTAGNFVDLVQRKFYDGMKVQRADGFVVQTGDPDGPADGFVDPSTDTADTSTLMGLSSGYKWSGGGVGDGRALLRHCQRPSRATTAPEC